MAHHARLTRVRLTHVWLIRPADVVAEFAGGRTMAVVGFEVDQVLKDPHGDGVDVSVPINVVYNHHFESTMAGCADTAAATPT